jgi:hypothetical protein
MEMSGQHHTLTTLPPGMSPRTHSIGGWVGSKGSLDILENRKISCPCWDLNRRPSNPQPSHYTNYAVPTSGFSYIYWLINNDSTVHNMWKCNDCQIINSEGQKKIVLHNTFTLKTSVMTTTLWHKIQT